MKLEQNIAIADQQQAADRRDAIIMTAPPDRRTGFDLLVNMTPLVRESRENHLLAANEVQAGRIILYFRQGDEWSYFISYFYRMLNRQNTHEYCALRIKSLAPRKTCTILPRHCAAVVNRLSEYFKITKCTDILMHKSLFSEYCAEYIIFKCYWISRTRWYDQETQDAQVITNQWSTSDKWPPYSGGFVWCIEQFG